VYDILITTNPAFEQERMSLTTELSVDTNNIILVLQVRNLEDVWFRGFWCIVSSASSHYSVLRRLRWSVLPSYEVRNLGCASVAPPALGRSNTLQFTLSVVAGGTLSATFAGTSSRPEMNMAWRVVR
jgi:hypothetical protein